MSCCWKNIRDGWIINNQTDFTRYHLEMHITATYLGMCLRLSVSVNWFVLRPAWFKKLLNSVLPTPPAWHSQQQNHLEWSDVPLLLISPQTMFQQLLYHAPLVLVSAIHGLSTQSYNYTDLSWDKKGWKRSSVWSTGNAQKLSFLKLQVRRISAHPLRYLILLCCT